MEKEKVKMNWDIQDKKTFISQEAINESFINTLMKIHKKSEADAEMIYERELMYTKQVLSDPKSRIKDCTNISFYSAFLEIAINGLSIQPGSKSEAYFESRGAKNGKDEKGNDAYINIARLCITAYGELNMRIMAGQIIRMMNPIVLYTGDKFQPKTNDHGRLIVDYQCHIPRQKDAKIFGCYVAIELPGGGLDFKWMLDDDIERLKKYSTPRSTKTNPNPEANDLYTSNNGQVDPGFLETKTIKHAMRAYTKLRVGDSVAFEGDDEFEEKKPESFEGNNTPEVKPEGIVIKGLDEDGGW